MSNNRVTLAAAVAVIAAAFSLYSLLAGLSWLAASIGAVAAVAIAGTLSRLAAVPAAIAATAAVLIALVPVLAGGGIIGAVAAVAVVGLTASSATGVAPLRAFATLATYLTVPFFLLNLVFASGSSFAGVVPTARSLRALGRTWSQASPQLHNYAPPIPASRPVELVTAAGVALVAICVDFLAVRARRPAVAGLPLLVLFSVPVASTLKSFGLPQTLGFGLGIAGYLSLLSSDSHQRLRMWGRLVTLRRTAPADEAGSRPDTRQLAASGRRVGLAAVCLAMVVPIVLVGKSPRDIFSTGTGGSGGPPSFSGTAGAVSPLDQTQYQLTLAKPQVVLTYKTTAPHPRQQYLQESVLNYSPGPGWVTYDTAADAVRARQLPLAVPGLNADIPYTSVTTSVTLVLSQGAPLPVPYAPVRISAAGTSLTENTGTLMVNDSQQQANMSYTVVSREPNLGPGVLGGSPASYLPAIARAYPAYDGPDASQLLRIAEKETAGATTPLQAADDLQAWFTTPGRFTYSVKTHWIESGGWLLRFLTKDPRGDCSQFAPAFAVLARLLGIPSRVAMGYTAGTPVGGGVWKVTTADAHAWPELYFPSVGWVRFEPTPSGNGEQGTATEPSYSLTKPAGGTGPVGQVTPTPTPTPSAGTGKGGHPPNGRFRQAGLGGPASTVKHGSGPGFPVGIPIAVVAALLLASPALGRWLTTRRRWMAAGDDAARAHAAWREFSDYLADYGFACLPSESPRAVAARIVAAADLGPATSAAVGRISRAEERARYALTAQPGTGLREDVLAVRKALAQSSTRTRRLQALALPASTLDYFREALHAASRVLSWLDSPLPSMRRVPRHAETGS